MAASAFELEMTSDERLTLLDLVLVVQDAAENDADIVATLHHMAETGHFHFDSGGFEDLPWAG